jgi:hypothetical protein
MEGPNPFIRHNVGTFNAMDMTDPFAVADEIGQFQNRVIPIPGTRGSLLDYITPTLVDVWNTAPFNHDGTFATLLHGVTPCDDSLDDCSHPDAGKNVRDQHGTTSNLTPKQLRQLDAFLDAPHNTLAGAVAFASPIRRLVRAVVTFGRTPAADDKLDLRARFRVGPTSDFEVQNRKLDEPLTISLADVDDGFVERTIPAGQMTANAAGTRFLFRDSTQLLVPGIRLVVLRLRAPATREWELSVRGQRLDLTSLDKNHLTIGVEVGDDAFVKSRTFTQLTPARAVIRVRER